MAGWDGSGNFVLNYSMVAEASAGVKILASHQDAQWQTIQTGLMNCLCRDGQNSPSADIPFNAKKITGLANPTAAQDAATKAYVDFVGYQEWIPEFGTFAWVSATTFKITGTDATFRYHSGRRVKIAHNTGATISYGTVVSSVFAVDTTVTVLMDGGTALVNTITGLLYGLISYSNSSFAQAGSAVSATILAASTAYAGAGAYTLLPFDVETVDNLNEFDAAGTHKFTCIYGGLYRVDGNLLISGTATFPNTVSVAIFKNAANAAFLQSDSLMSTGFASVTINRVLRFAAGDVIDLRISTLLTCTIVGTNGGTSFTLTRVG